METYLRKVVDYAKTTLDVKTLELSAGHVDERTNE